ncbi:hypothetical protein K7432_018589, partial [Basidiobolus ranarum]
MNTNTTTEYVEQSLKVTFEYEDLNMPYNYCTPVALGLRDEVHDVDQELLLLHEVVQAPPALPDGTAVGESVTSLGGG